MDFGLVLQTDPPASAVVGLMRRAERNGFRYGWTFDSAVLWQSRSSSTAASWSTPRG
ncbi:hypothetical protein SALBM135S_00818 [Streptomyces alboniger]